MASSTSLTPKQTKFAELLALGELTDTEAYMRAYRCSEKNARANASRMAHHDGVRTEMLRIRAAMDESYLTCLSSRYKKARLVKVMMEGSHADAIRAIQVLNQMEQQERELGAVEKDEFTELIAIICRKRRLLPHEDPDENLDLAFNDPVIDV